MLKENKKVESFANSITEMLDYFRVLKDEREEKYESRSDNWQEGEAGMEYMENNELLDELVMNLEDVETSLSELYTI